MTVQVDLLPCALWAHEPVSLFPDRAVPIDWAWPPQAPLWVTAACHPDGSPAMIRRQPFPTLPPVSGEADTLGKQIEREFMFGGMGGPTYGQTVAGPAIDRPYEENPKRRRWGR